MEAGKHGFIGACAPGEQKVFMGFNQLTFSVGIFEWIPKSGGKGVKKSAVKVRVTGPCSNPEAVKAKAEEIVAQLDAGTYSGPKNVKV